MIEIPFEMITDIINNTDFLEWLILLIKTISQRYYTRFYIRISNNVLFIKIYDSVQLLSN